MSSITYHFNPGKHFVTGTALQPDSVTFYGTTPAKEKNGKVRVEVGPVLRQVNLSDWVPLLSTLAGAVRLKDTVQHRHDLSAKEICLNVGRACVALVPVVNLALIVYDVVRHLIYPTAKVAAELTKESPEKMTIGFAIDGKRCKETYPLTDERIQRLFEEKTEQQHDLKEIVRKYQDRCLKKLEVLEKDSSTDKKATVAEALDQITQTILFPNDQSSE